MKCKHFIGTAIRGKRNDASQIIPSNYFFKRFHDTPGGHVSRIALALLARTDEHAARMKTCAGSTRV
ncbi:MAG TPA: hypothetical protein VLC92_15080 [Rhodocyclaceae bacterium]|nr:hypothetical protein [Rhodocyclaceae bacterium]